MKGRVLVVDDDPALAEMLGIVLRGEGFDPAFVADGGRALNSFRDFRPDVVLLDLMLPGMSGIDVCKLIRAESGVPIIMLTAKSDTVDVGFRPARRARPKAAQVLPPRGAAGAGLGIPARR